jgi:hypothetical protein
MTSVSILKAKLEQGNRSSTAVALAWPVFCVQKGIHSVSSVWITESYFSTWLLCFWALFTQIPCVPGILQLRNPKMLVSFSTPAVWKKEWIPMKSVTFCWSCIWLWKIQQSSPQISQDKSNASYSIYQMMSRILGFDGYISDANATGASRCVQWSTQHRYTSSSVSFNRNALHLVSCAVSMLVIDPSCEQRGGLHKNFPLEIEKFLKKSKTI